MSTTAQQYREFAAECLRWATEVQTENDRQSFLDMARNWTLAAMRLEGTLVPTGEHQSSRLSSFMEKAHRPPQLAR
jgi:hypothetical protein